ncbi:MAG: NAD(P)-dependent oxidoreductase [Deltaproteobacteria bacterium]|nr:NAD(P)-dependent oxidoreductase [Deltaproteobacteria bacterium]
MLSDEKILITGISGTIAMPLARSLALNNEVWGLARFGDPADRERVEAAGVKTVALDLCTDDLSELGTDFTYVLHLAYFRGGAADFDQAISVNGEGTGRILHHCRNARAALVMSSNVVYSPHEDPWYLPKETDAIGGANVFWSPTSSTAKIAEEAVARYCARAFELPVTIARLNTVYGLADKLMPVFHMDAVVAGKEVVARWDPNPHTPIHTDDLCDQLEALLDAASIPATIVNWGGDEPVTVQEWCAYAAELAGTQANVRVQSVAGASRGGGTDPAKRRAITGPCRVPFRDGFRGVYTARYPQVRGGEG